MELWQVPTLQVVTWEGKQAKQNQYISLSHTSGWEGLEWDGDGRAKSGPCSNTPANILERKKSVDCHYSSL